MTLSADVDFIAKYSVGKSSPQFNRRFKIYEMCCNITHGWLTVSKNSISKANCFLKFCLSETSKEATIVNFTFRNGPEFSAQTIIRKAGLTNNRFILAFENKKSNLNLKIWFSAFIRILLLFFLYLLHNPHHVE